MVPGHAGGADQADRERVREADAELEQPARADLQHLDFQHHLRLGEVVRGDQPLGQAHRVRRVLDHQQVELLVDEEVPRLHQRAHHVGGLAHVGVGEVEALHHQLLVLALLLRRVRVDQQRGLVHHLLLELVGGEHQADQLLGLRRCAARWWCAASARTSRSSTKLTPVLRVRVSNTARSVHVAQLERDRPAGGLQARRDDRRRGGALLDQALQAPRVALLRVLDQHRAQRVLRLEVALVLDQLLRRGDLAAVARVGLELLQAGAGAHVVGVVLLHPAIERRGGLGLAARAQGLGLRQPLRDREVAHAQVLGAVLEAVRMLAAGALEQRERLLGAPGGDVVARLAQRRIDRRGAAREQDDEEQAYAFRSPFLPPAAGRW